jgi:transcription initiation factor TFIIIB Brf1 subunit/transcription initiation factor TFIIB
MSIFTQDQVEDMLDEQTAAIRVETLKIKQFVDNLTADSANLTPSWLSDYVVRFLKARIDALEDITND